MTNWVNYNPAAPNASATGFGPGGGTGPTNSTQEFTPNAAGNKRPAQGNASVPLKYIKIEGDGLKQKRPQVKNACGEQLLDLFDECVVASDASRGFILVHCQRACKKCDGCRPCERCVRELLLKRLPDGSDLISACFSMMGLQGSTLMAALIRPARSANGRRNGTRTVGHSWPL